MYLCAGGGHLYRQYRSEFDWTHPRTMTRNGTSNNQGRSPPPGIGHKDPLRVMKHVRHKIGLPLPLLRVSDM